VSQSTSSGQPQEVGSLASSDGLSYRRPRTVRSNIVFTFALAVGLALAWHVRNVILLVYVSALFAVVLMPIVGWMMRLKFGRWRLGKVQAIVALLLLAVGAVVLFATFALPPVAQDLQSFTKELPSRTPIMIERAKQMPFVNHLDLTAIASRLEDMASGFATFVFLSLKDWAGVFLDVITGVVLTVYFMIEGENAYQWILSFFPPLPRRRLDGTLRRAKLRMGKWLLAQGALMLILGICSTIVFLFLKIRYAYALGVMMGVFNIVPVAGAMASMVVVLLVASIDSWGRVLGALIFYALWAQTENSLLIPKIMKSSVDLAALAVLISLLLGAALAGVAGALVSVPTAVLVAVLLDEYMVNREPVPELPPVRG
jgi:predicted PurR-regulated permease PerM